MTDDTRVTQDDHELDEDAREALMRPPGSAGAAAPATSAGPPIETGPSLAEAETGSPPSKLFGILAFVAVGLLAVGALFAYLGVQDSAPPTQAANIAAKLELAAGEVVLLPAEGAEGAEDGAGERLLSGTPLPTGAKLRTGPGSRALVRLADGSRIFLNQASSVSLGENGEITVLAGQVWLETLPLDDKDEPLTHTVGPAGIALSEGGASLTLTEEGATIYVADGLATLTSEGGRKEVHSGEEAVVTPGKAPVVSSVTYWPDWTGGMAKGRAGGRVGGGSGSLYAVDLYAPPGTPALPLSISSQIVDVAIDAGLAETRVDQRFFNPSDRDVEGWYWFTVPEGATLVGFALETDGRLIEGEIVEKKQAVATYQRAVVSNDNPALLEWIDERTVRARVYPVPKMGERRVVVRYQQLLSEQDGKLRYSYPLAESGGREAPTLDEFALAVELRGDLGQRYAVSTLDEATVSNNDALITMRRTGFRPRADFELELTRKAGATDTNEAKHGGEGQTAALRLNQFESGADQARFVMLRWIPEIDFAALPSPRADVIIVVDTSAFGDESEHQSRIAVAEALLRSLSSEDRFALMAADLSAEVVFPSEGLTEASRESIDEALEALRGHRQGGATDLGAIFERALAQVHDADQPAIIYIGDGLATSGERGADALAERLRRALAGSRARLFTVGVGAAVEDRLLARLARIGGGESVRVEVAEQAVVAALELSSALKTPTITDLELDLGATLDDRFDSATGKLTRGQELVVLARTHNELPETATVRGRVGGEAFEREIPIVRSRGALDQVVPKLWAATRIERLLGDGRGPEAVRGKVLALGLEYGLMTPFTSFLALESEGAYARQGVERRKRPWDFNLLGQVLPSEREIILGGEGRDPFGSDSSPSATELLVGALTAPMGCSAPAGSKSEDAVAMARDDAPSGAGQRHQGEEGRMGKSSPSPTPSAAKAEEPMDEDFGDREMEEEMVMDAPAEAAPSAPPPPGAMADGSLALGGEGAAGGGRGGLEDLNQDFGTAPEPDPSFADDLAAPSSTASGFAQKAKKSAGYRGRDKNSNSDLDALSEVDEKLAMGRPKPRPLPHGSESKGGSKDSASRRQTPKVVSPVARNEKRPCSDASARPLAQRKVLWEQRLARATDMIAHLRAYENAAASCELDSPRQQRVFMQLLATAAGTEAEIALLLAHFEAEQEAQAFLARALLRRLVDPALIGAVERNMFGGALDWRSVDEEAARATSAAGALAIVDAALAKHADASEDERLPLELLRIDLLLELRRVDEAITIARKLRERGLITPLLAQRLGELLVEAGEVDEAKRVFSEIVEYDPSSAYTRRLLGDIFLRHGWHQEAYHQYKDLVAVSGEPSDLIRMARAAAGAGRVDEGLRILRQVQTGEGRPGVDDPRRFARLHAAVLLAEMLASKDELPREAIARELKRLGLFDTATTWTFVTWTDLEHELTLGVEAPPIDADAKVRAAAQAAALRTSDGRSAGDTGLWAIQAGDLDDLLVRHRGVVPTRAVAFERIEVRWDGQEFAIERQLGEVAARAAREAEDAGDSEDAEADDSD